MFKINMATDWTNMVRDALRNMCNKQSHEERLKLNTGLSIQPDVLWKDKNEKIKVVFEIDSFTRGDYQKTIFGSMFSGVILAKEKNVKFVEIVPKGAKNSKKAKQIAKSFKKHFHENIYVIEIPNNRNYRHIQYNLKNELSRLGIKAPN